MSLSTVMSHLSFVCKRKTDSNLPKSFLLPKCFSKKTMSQVLLLSASPLSNKKALVDIYPQNHKKSVLKQSYIQSSSCGKYDSNVFLDSQHFGESPFFVWWFGTKKRTVPKHHYTPEKLACPLKKGLFWIGHTSSNHPFSGASCYPPGN